MRGWWSVGLVLVAVGRSAAEVFTAMADMENLLGAEKHVTGVIDQYIDHEQERLTKLRKFAAEYEKRNADALTEGLDFVANPVNAYLLIKRLTSDWGFVESMMKNNMADEFLTNITSNRKGQGVRFPDEEDLKGAADALLRLQDTYRLSTADIADGKIQGVKRAEELQAHDCFELGRVAYNAQDYYHTVLWMREALERMENEEPPSVDESDILEYLAYGLYQQGNVKRALTMTKRLLSIAPDHPRAQGNVDYYTGELAKDGKAKGDNMDLPPEMNPRPDLGGVPEREMYEALCRGEVPVSEKTLAKYYCYYKRDKPYLWLAPLRVEVVHLSPMAVKFVGAVSNDEVEAIKRLATPKLARATVQNSVTGELETASYRVSKSAWLKGTDDQVIARINKRIGDMTNLNMDTAEDLQIANYGLGGHYDPHYDFARIANYGLGGHYDPHYDMSTKEETNAFKGLGTGNRIATILFYLEAPDAGGATVFPELKLSLFPTKNDCVFWYNLLKNGDGDMRTRHAACPVLSGQKWVANKWIHERGQEFEQRPCGLRRRENEIRVADEPLVHYPFRG